jgi:hypothetical protein
VGIVVGTAAAVWGLTAISLLLIGRIAREPRTVEIVIPPGTAAGLEAGVDVLRLPRTLSLVAGDELVVRNDDRVTHIVGPNVVAPGQTVRAVVRPSLAGAFTCTVHPSGTLALEVRPRGLDLRLTVLPTLLIGVPLGLGLLGLVEVLRRLGASDGPDPSRVSAGTRAAGPSDPGA